MNIELHAIDQGRLAYRSGAPRESCPPYRIARWCELWLAAWDEQQADDAARRRRLLERRIDRFCARLKAELVEDLS